jgi:hypothetical protein
MSSPGGKRTIAGLRPAALVFALVALAAAVTGVAFAAATLVGIPGADGRFYACVNNSSGELRLVTSDDSCADQTWIASAASPTSAVSERAAARSA